MKFKHLKNVHIQYPPAVMFNSCEAVPINLKATQNKLFVATGMHKITELGIAIDEKQTEASEKLQVSHERRSLVHVDTAFDEKARIHHVGNYRIWGKTMAVVCTNQGVFVEFDGTLHALLTQLHPEVFDPHTLYGPTAVFQDRVLCIGTSSGNVLFYRAYQQQPQQHVQREFSGGKSTGSNRLGGEQLNNMSVITRKLSTDALNFGYCGSVKLLASGITAMAADSRSLAVADKSGRVFVLNVRSASSTAAADVPAQCQPLEFNCCGGAAAAAAASNTNLSTNTPLSTKLVEVTCMRFSQLPHDDFLIVGTTSGKIQYYERTTGQLRYEVDAHAKSISDMSVRNSALLTTSQDGFVRVWIIDDNTDRLIHTQSIKIDDAHPTGVTFLSDRMFCVVSYDDPTVQFFEACVG